VRPGPGQPWRTGLGLGQWRASGEIAGRSTAAGDAKPEERSIMTKADKIFYSVALAAYYLVLLYL
jgi:hypothetical protein